MDAIVKIESSIVSEFNSYLQRESPAMTFIEGSDGYFRFSTGTPSSAGIEAFGNFLQTSGYQISVIGSGTTKEGDEGTVMHFTKEGKEQEAVLSTIRIY